VWRRTLPYSRSRTIYSCWPKDGTRVGECTAVGALIYLLAQLVLNRVPDPVRDEEDCQVEHTKSKQSRVEAPIPSSPP